MAAQFGQTSDRVSRSDSVPSPSAGFTVLGWARIDTDTNAPATLARIWTAGLGTVATFATSTDGTGGPNYFTAGGSITSTIDFVVGQWRRVAITCTGTTGKVYAATPTGSTQVVSGTVSTGTPGGITLGGRDTSDATESLLGTLAYWRVFASELTQAQIEAEWASPVAVLSAWADWPLGSDLNDISGNARHLSAGTTPVDWVTGPDLPGGSAVLAGTLRRATLGATATVTASAALLAGMRKASLAASATVTADGALAGLLPRATTAIALNVVAPVTAALHAQLPKIKGGTGIVTNMELRMQRRNTQAFIEASPVDIALVPSVEQRRPSGAIAVTSGVPRPVQRFRLIPMSHTERPVTSSSGAGADAGGVQRKHDLTLLGNWDSEMAAGDYWYDENDQKYIVDEVIPFNGYERKGLVMSYGRRGSIVQ